MDESAAPGTFVDEGGCIIDDVPCDSCGYNLRGLNERGLCGECGEPVGLSLRAMDAMGDVGWIRNLRSGMVCGQFGVLLAPFAVLVDLLLVRSIAVLFLMMLVAGGVAFWGWWQFTSSPAFMDHPARVRSRMCAAAIIFMCMIGLVIPLQDDSATMIFAVAGLAAATVGVFFAGTWAMQIASRIAGQSLVDQTRKLMWADGLIGGNTLLFGLLSLILGEPNQVVSQMATANACLLVICTPVFGGLTFLLMIRYWLKLNSICRRFDAMGVD